MSSDIQELFVRDSFPDISGWNFFDGQDPTHGNTKYLSRKDAMARGLAYIQGDNSTVMGVDDKSTVPVNGLRNSCVCIDDPPVTDLEIYYYFCL